MTVGKLTDKQHKKIIAMYADCQNYSQVARQFGVSVNTIKRHVNGDLKAAKLVNEKKEQNTQDMLAFLDANKQSAQEFILMAMEALKDPEKLSKTGAQSIAVALGIIIDKFMPVEKKDANEGVEIVWGRRE